MGFKYEELDWREKEILTAVLGNPNLNHNALKKKLVETGKVMSRIAFENAIKRLKAKEWLCGTKDGNKIIYDVPRKPYLANDESDRDALEWADALKEKFNKAKAVFHEAKLHEKIKHVTIYLEALRDMRYYLETLWLSSYGIMDRTEVQKEIRLGIDKSFSDVFKLISDDGDADRIKVALTINAMNSITGPVERWSLIEEYYRDYVSETWKIDDAAMKRWKDNYNKIMKIASEEVKEIIFKYLTGQLEDKEAMEQVTEMHTRDIKEAKAQLAVLKEKNPNPNLDQDLDLDKWVRDSNLDLIKWVAELIKFK